MAFLFIASSCSDDSKEVEQEIKDKTTKGKLLGSWIPYSYKKPSEQEQVIYEDCGASLPYWDTFISKTFRFDDDDTFTWFYHCAQTPYPVIANWEIITLGDTENIISMGGDRPDDGGAYLLRIVRLEENTLILDQNVPNADNQYDIEIKLIREQ